MLSDPHIKVKFFEQDSKKVFPGPEIKGGVAVLYRNSQKNFGEIGIFTIYEELNSIIHKVAEKKAETLDKIMSGQGIYKFTSQMHKENPQVKDILSKSHPNDVGTGVLGTLHNILFFEEKPKDQYEYSEVLGRYNNDRAFHFIRTDYINEPLAFDKYRVVLPKANGTGKLGETLSSPLIVSPYFGFTQTFISIGAFDGYQEAESCLKYIKSKFARTMLGVLKITQDNPKDKWKKVPLQDFTPNSDIDWTKSIAEIDQQLYQKYGLDEKEIAFIEEKVREME